MTSWNRRDPRRASAAGLALAGLTLAAFATACATEGPAPDEEAPPDKVRAVVMPYLSFMPFHIAAEEGLFAEQNLDVEFVRLQRIQDLMTGLARGDVDVAAGMFTVGIANSIAGGARVRLVGALAHLGAEDCTFTGIVARRALLDDGTLEDPKRLRTLSWDTDVMIPYGYWLQEAISPQGLTLDELDLVNLPEPTAVEAIRNGSLDVTMSSEPFLGLLRDSPEAHLWIRVQEVVPDYQISSLMYGPALLDERPEVGERFAVAMLGAIRRYLEGKTPRNLEIVERATGLDPEQLRSACWPSARADGEIPAGIFDDYQAWMLRTDLVERTLQDEEIVDRRFMRHAVETLGPQR